MTEDGPRHGTDALEVRQTFLSFNEEKDHGGGGGRRRRAEFLSGCGYQAWDLLGTYGECE